jgi:hypothetical protein
MRALVLILLVVVAGIAAVAPLSGEARLFSPPEPTQRLAPSEAVDDPDGLAIPPGTARLLWTVQLGDGQTACSASARLRRPGDQQTVATLFAVQLTEPDHPVESGEMPMDTLPTGRYVLDTTGNGCWWAFTSQPR